MKLNVLYGSSIECHQKYFLHDVNRYTLQWKLKTFYPALSAGYKPSKPYVLYGSSIEYNQKHFFA